MANYYSLTASSKYTQRRATCGISTESRKFVQLINYRINEQNYWKYEKEELYGPVCQEFARIMQYQSITKSKEK